MSLEVNIKLPLEVLIGSSRIALLFNVAVALKVKKKKLWLLASIVSKDRIVVFAERKGYKD